MTWPSPSLPLPTNQLNATPQFDTHPADHATTNTVINDDVAPQISANIVNIQTNADDIATLDSKIDTEIGALTTVVDDHIDTSWVPFTVTLTQTNMSPTGPNTVAGFYQVRHGLCHAYCAGNLSGTNPTGPAETTMSIALPVPAVLSQGVPAYGFLKYDNDSVPFVLSLVNTGAGFITAQADGATALKPINDIATATLLMEFSYRTNSADT